MKTKYRFLFVLTLMFTLVTSAWAEQSWDCGNTKVTLSDDGVFTVTAVDGTDGKMADYESSDNVPWVNYQYRNKIYSVVVSDGVTSIGKYAFYNFPKVQSVSIGKDVKSIGSYAFSQWWNNVRSLTLPASVEFIGSYALNSSNIENLYVKATVPPVMESSEAISWFRIYVPETSVDAYKAAEYWSNYSYNISIDFSDGFIPFAFDFSGYATVNGTVWKGLKQSMNITLNDGLTIASRNNLAEDNTFTPAKDAKDFAFGFTVALPDAANLSFEQEQLTANLFFSPADQTDQLTISAGTPDEKGVIANVKAGDEVKMAVNKQGYRFKDVSLIPQLSGATFYRNCSVAYADLKVGDIIISNVEVTDIGDKSIRLTAYRWADPNGIGQWDSGFGGYFYVDENAMVGGWYRPINEKSAEGNAWMVDKIVEGNDWSAGVYFVGVTCDVEVTYNEKGTEATFTMLEDNVTVNYVVARDLTIDVDLDVLIDDKPATRVPIAKNTDGYYRIVGNWQFAATDKMDGNKKLTNGELTYTLKKKEGDEYISVNTETDLAPGIWRLEATANEGYPYAGTIYGVDIELIDKFDIALKAANANTIEAGKATLKVGDEQMAPTEGKVEGVKIGTKVTITAKDGYKFRKAEGKKGIVALKTLTVGGDATGVLTYAEGETWGQAIQNHPTENAGWTIGTSSGSIFYDFAGVWLGNNRVKKDDAITPGAGYFIE